MPGTHKCPGGVIGARGREVVAGTRGLVVGSRGGGGGVAAQGSLVFDGGHSAIVNWLIPRLWFLVSVYLPSPGEDNCNGGEHHQRRDEKDDERNAALPAHAHVLHFERGEGRGVRRRGK